MWTKEEVQVVRQFLFNIRLYDTGYNDHDGSIGFRFSGFGYDDRIRPEGESGFFHLQTLKKAQRVVFKQSNQPSPQENSEILEDQADSFPEEIAARLALLPHAIRQYPITAAYQQGITEGVKAMYCGSYKTNERTQFERTISEREIDLAILSGAVFGNKDALTLRRMEQDLKKAMRYSRPHSFSQLCLSLFSSASRDQSRGEEDREKRKRRIGLLEESLFERVRKDAFTFHPSELYR